MHLSSMIQTPVTHNPEESLSFYRRLGFESVPGFDQTTFSDGKVLVSINEERTARVAIRLFGNWEGCLENLSSLTQPLELENRLQLSDPSGVQLFLEPEASFEVSGSPSSSLGNFAGLSIETTDFGRSLKFWESLGYQGSCGAESQGWMTLEKEGFVGISLMKVGACPHLFFSPGLTYFNSGNNLENIARIRDAEVEITEEISCFNSEGVVDNVILRDPGGLGFFVFND